MAQKRPTASTKPGAKKAGLAVDNLRRSVGLPTGALATDISAKIRKLAKDKNVLVEWEVRVLRRGETVAAICNCCCYA